MATWFARLESIQPKGFPESEFTVPVHTRRPASCSDYGQLTTAYPSLTVAGGLGAKVRLTYSEAWLDDKGRRETAIRSKANTLSARARILSGGQDCRGIHAAGVAHMALPAN